MQVSGERITPFLWFDTQAEEAARFYTSVFHNSKILTTTHYGEGASAASGRPKGSVMTVAFELDGQSFVALNGGPLFKFTEAVSFVVNCEDQTSTGSPGRSSRRTSASSWAAPRRCRRCSR